MQRGSHRIGELFMKIQAYYALVVSLAWIFVTEIMFVSIFAGYTGQTLADAIAGGPKQAELWLITQRMIGIEVLPISILMIFVTLNSYSKGEKWSWFALLIVGTVTWGGLIGYKVMTGYFNTNASSMTFIIGAILFLIGITVPAKAILSKE
jgi:hypothetical protein